MPSGRILIKRAAGIVNLISATIDSFGSLDPRAIGTTLDCSVTVREDTAVGDPVEALAVREERLGVGLEPRARGKDDFVQDFAVVIEGPELLLARCLPDVPVGLD